MLMEYDSGEIFRLVLVQKAEVTFSLQECSGCGLVECCKYMLKNAYVKINIRIPLFYFLTNEISLSLSGFFSLMHIYSC
jgi:hypothetical protein